MPKILLCGDPHGDLSRTIHEVIEHRPDATILLGDITPRAPLHVALEIVNDLTQFWWIPGNHDTDSEEHYDNLFESEWGHRNLHGCVGTIAGLRVAGLGGVFRGKVWDGIEPAQYQSPEEFMAQIGKGNRFRDGLSLRHRSTIFPSTFDRLAAQRADILVTHEGPDHCHNGNPALTRLADQMKVRAAFHGHHHQNIAYENTVWRQVGSEDTFLFEY